VEVSRRSSGVAKADGHASASPCRVMVARTMCPPILPRGKIDQETFNTEGTEGREVTEDALSRASTVTVLDPAVPRVAR
jgi:hypothetical protein